ncbi:hypothetical protein ABK040_015557 [Willaertia magna]
MSEDDENDFFINPSLLKDESTLDEIDYQLERKLKIAEYDDDKNDETFGDDETFNVNVNNNQLDETWNRLTEKSRNFNTLLGGDGIIGNKRSMASSLNNTNIWTALEEEDKVMSNILGKTTSGTGSGNKNLEASSFLGFFNPPSTVTSTNRREEEPTFITDLIEEDLEDEGFTASNNTPRSSGSGNINNNQTSISGYPLTGGLDTLDYMPVVILHKHHDHTVPLTKAPSTTTSTVATEKTEEKKVTPTTPTKESKEESNNQKEGKASYLSIKYNTYNTIDKLDCYNVINKGVINDVLNRIIDAKFKHFRTQDSNQRFHSQHHRIIQFMRIDEIESIIRQQMVDLQITNPYLDDYYYYFHQALSMSDNTEENKEKQEGLVDCILKSWSLQLQNEEENKNKEQQQGKEHATRLFGRIPSQNVRCPRTCFDTNIFREELVNQYYLNKKVPLDSRNRLIYNNGVQLRTSIENGMTLLLDINEFLMVHHLNRKTELNPNVVQSFNNCCQTVAAYLQYYQEIWNLSQKGKKFICKSLRLLPEPYITKLIMDMIPILCQESNNLMLIEAMQSACRSLFTIDAISVILVHIMQHGHPGLVLDFLIPLLNQSLVILSNPHHNELSLQNWYHVFITQFIPYFMSNYAQLVIFQDKIYILASIILQLIPKHVPQFFAILHLLSNDPNNTNPLKNQILIQFSQ